MSKKSGEPRYSKKSVNNICSSPSEDTMESLEAIVEAYIIEHRHGAENEMRFYELQKKRGKLIDYAGWAKMANGKRHPHQYRITKLALGESVSRLQSRDFTHATNFDDLLLLVEQTIADIPGIGELTVYDTATRIAAGFGIEPDKIYLHAGVREGAKALNLDRGQRFLEKDELPLAFQKLRPHEIEDCLCIYKNALHQLSKVTE